MINYALRASYIIFNYLKSNYPGRGYWLIPLNACPVVPLTFQAANIAFKFVDVEPLTYCMNREKTLEAVKDPECIGVLFIYTYGLELSFEAFFQSIKSTRSDIKIIEDKCVSIPSFDEAMTSDHVDLTVYSTGYAKIVDIGVGGYGIIKKGNQYGEHPTNFRVRSEREITDYYKDCLANDRYMSINNASWLNDGKVKNEEVDAYRAKVLKKREDILKHKQEMNSIYKDYIPQELWLKVDDQTVNNWRFNLMVEEQEKLIQMITSEGLFASTHYQPLDNVFDVEVLGDTKTSYYLYNSVINLFNDQYFTQEMAKDVAQIIANAYSGRKAYVNSI